MPYRKPVGTGKNAHSYPENAHLSDSEKGLSKRPKRIVGKMWRKNNPQQYL